MEQTMVDTELRNVGMKKIRILTNPFDHDGDHPDVNHDDEEVDDDSG